MNLTPYQLNVLELMFFGKTNGEIAQILGTSYCGAANAVNKVVEALDATNRCNAVYRALGLGLLKPPKVSECASPARSMEPQPITRGNVELDPGTRRVTANGQDVRLGVLEFRILEFFLGHCGRVFSRDMLIDHVWGVGHPIEPRTIDVHIARLRRALAPHGCGHLIETERGVGYVCARAA